MGEFLKLYAKSPAQCYPIFEETYDNVEGILASSDVFIALAQDKITGSDVVTDIARTAYFVPETKTVGELFREMREEGYLMSVVLDEYGGSSGIVCIDQLIEEIVGEVKEDIVGSKRPYTIMGDNVYSIQGGMRIDEAKEQIGLELPVGDYKTIGGFALNLFGHLPKEGERIEFEDLAFVASKVRDNKIIRLSVNKEERPEISEEIADDQSDELEEKKA